MNPDLIGTGTRRLQLWAMVPAGFFQPLEFVQQVVGLFALPVITKWLVTSRQDIDLARQRYKQLGG